ncbi:hypothetical protein Q8F55_007390 [Vanrija albida]|uniref:Uncharacterized protein n=1 Tax=Vanrija albida TaxID=181172 RepID=A0ABR3PTD5_9TREE
MLLKTVIITLVASLAVAAPAKMVSPRDDLPVTGGVSIQCFYGKNCKGNDNATPAKYGVKHGETYNEEWSVLPGYPFSCKFKTWDDWKGRLVLGGYDRSPLGFKEVSDVGYSDGSGEVCLTMWDSAWDFGLDWVHFEGKDQLKIVTHTYRY